MGSLKVSICVTLILFSGLVYTSDAWGFAYCNCGNCDPGCRPVRRYFYGYGGSQQCTCSCVCDSPSNPPPKQQNPFPNPQLPPQNPAPTQPTPPQNPPETQPKQPSPPQNNPPPFVFPRQPNPPSSRFPMPSCLQSRNDLGSCLSYVYGMNYIYNYCCGVFIMSEQCFYFPAPQILPYFANQYCGLL